MGKISKKDNAIWHIIQLIQVMKRPKVLSLQLKHIFSDFDSDSDDSAPNIPSGFLAVYVGEVRMRFLIRTRFLNLPIFVYLLKIAEEEYGFNFNGGIALPCEVEFFKQVLKFLEEDEKKYGNLGLHGFLKLIREKGFDSSSCKEDSHPRQRFIPHLLHKYEYHGLSKLYPSFYSK